LEDSKLFAVLQNAVSQSPFIARKFKTIGDKEAFCRIAGIRNYANRAEAFSVLLFEGKDICQARKKYYTSNEQAFMLFRGGNERSIR
jgi:hypothetical protein